MIVRIMGEGQWRVNDTDLDHLNELDDAVEKAVTADDQEALTNALEALLGRVRDVGTVVPDEELVDSDLVLPDSSVLIEEMRSWIADQGAEGSGLIPG